MNAQYIHFRSILRIKYGAEFKKIQKLVSREEGLHSEKVLEQLGE